jgi:hypothetical protein
MLKEFFGGAKIGRREQMNRRTDEQETRNAEGLCLPFVLFVIGACC